MSKSPVLELELTPETENPKFKSWRTKLAGSSPDSNMMIIDNAVGGIQEWQDNKETTPLTWGMLKHGLGWTPEP